MSEPLSVLEVETPRASYRGHMAMLLFVAVSLFVTMSLSQMESFGRGSPQYWLLVGLAVLMPMLDLPKLIRTLFERAKLLLIFLLWAGGWCLFKGDWRAVVQLFALVLATAWISTNRASINVRSLTRLYLLLLVVGISTSLFSSFNRYGLIPGYSDPAYGLWRVSFFPNIAYSGLLSLVMLMVLTSRRQYAEKHSIVLAVAVYFLVFSFVRAALLAALVYLLLYFYFRKRESLEPRRMFWLSLAVAIAFHATVFWSADILYLLQNNPLVSTFLLRGETGLTTDDILFQMYRPWLWATHFHLFLSSPAWMGWGSPESYQMVLDAAGPPISTIGSEAIPTRLLASYGMAGMLFTVYVVQRFRELALAGDRWACASFPAVFIVMMNWGGVFHPTDGMFVLLMLVAMQGSAAFVDPSSSDASLGYPSAPLIVRTAGSGNVC